MTFYSLPFTSLRSSTLYLSYRFPDFLFSLFEPPPFSFSRSSEKLLDASLGHAEYDQVPLKERIALPSLKDSTRFKVNNVNRNLPFHHTNTSFSTKQDIYHLQNIHIKNEKEHQISQTCNKAFSGKWDVLCLKVRSFDSKQPF